MASWLLSRLWNSSNGKTNPAIQYINSVFVNSNKLLDEEDLHTASRMSSSSSSTRIVPDFANLEPMHIRSAVEWWQQQQEEQKRQPMSKGARATPGESLRTSSLLDQYEAQTAPLTVIQRLATVRLMLVAQSFDTQYQNGAWEEALTQATQALQQEQLQLLVNAHTLWSGQQQDGASLNWAIPFLVQQYQLNHGPIPRRLTAQSERNGNKDSNGDEEEILQQHVQQVKSHLRSGASPRQILVDLYTWIAILQQQASRFMVRQSLPRDIISETKIHDASSQSPSKEGPPGPNSLLDWHFAHHRMLKQSQVHALLQQLAIRLQPHVRHEAQRLGIRSQPVHVALDEYLTHSSSNSKGRTSSDSDEFLQQYKLDRATMVRLERHVTLNGALDVAFRLCRDLFGVTIEECHDPDVKGRLWNKDVRVFDVYDHDDEDDVSHNVVAGSNPSDGDDNKQRSYRGYFLLDPLARSNKWKQCMVLPLHLGTNHPDKHTVVVASIDVAPPTWDTDPPVMTWQNVKELFHELGHVIPFFTTQTNFRSIMGPQNMPVDLSEFLPQFMEHWLTEKSTIYALMDASASEAPKALADHDLFLVDDAMDAALRVRSHEKALALARQGFYSALELAMLSPRKQGDASLLDLQQTLAKEWIPYDIPERKDLTPLVEVMIDNVQGHVACRYRYLYGDVLSAIVFTKFKEGYAARGGSAMDEWRGRIRRLVLKPGAKVSVAAWEGELGTDLYDVKQVNDLLNLYNL